MGYVGEERHIFPRLGMPTNKILVAKIKLRTFCALTGTAKFRGKTKIMRADCGQFHGLRTEHIIDDVPRPKKKTNLALWQPFGPNAVSSLLPVHRDPCQTLCAYPIGSIEKNESVISIHSK